MSILLRDLIEVSGKMKIADIYVYPIKSLLGVRLEEAELTECGISGDREFMLLRDYENEIAPKGGHFENMQVSHYAEMVNFQTSYKSSENGIRNDTLQILHTNPEDKSTRYIQIPSNPDVSNLEPFEVNLHLSPVTGYNMGKIYNEWFSGLFKFKVVLVYIGNRRRIVYGNLAPNASERNRWKQENKQQRTSWVRSVAASLSQMMSTSYNEGIEEEDYSICFSDVSPYLVITRESVANVSGRLSEGQSMDQRKFRPNIVLDGSLAPFEEDYWAELLFHSESEIKLYLTNNCVRCPSLNVDFDTGKPGIGETGQVLKKLQVDRRVDKGAKWNPVFGRYGFVDRNNLLAGDCRIRIGDKVEVAATNAEHTEIKWPGLAGPKDVFWPI